MGSAGRDRALMRQQRAAINSDLTKSITRSIQLGEARAKKVEIAASAGIAAAKKSLNTLASEKIEKYANKVFAIVNGNRQKIADNYLSLKAYAATAADKVQAYVAKGKGRNLSSIGDLLRSARLCPPGQGRGCGRRCQDSSSPVLQQDGEDRQPRHQDQLPRRRVHQAPRPGPAALANGSRQVPPLQGRVQHAEPWCPRGRPY